jgi:ribosomal protein L11 methyltransferase
VAEPELVRWTLRAPAAEIEVALAAALAAFPDGVVEEREGDEVLISGYAPPGTVPALDATPAAVPAGWRDGWRAFHRPVRVGRFWIGPPWLTPPAGAEAIVIEPGLAFGTGAHGSTRAAAALLLRDPAQRAALLDIGCGSGVLAVLGARLGHRPVQAFDLDPDAVAAAHLNAAANGVDVAVFTADALGDPIPAAALQIANLQHSLLVPLAARGVLGPRVIVSGLRASEDFAAAGYHATDRETCDGWQALLLERG